MEVVVGVPMVSLRPDGGLAARRDACHQRNAVALGAPVLVLHRRNVRDDELFGHERMALLDVVVVFEDQGDLTCTESRKQLHGHRDYSFGKWPVRAILGVLLFMLQQG